MKMTLVNNFYSWVKTVLLSNGNNHLMYTQDAMSTGQNNRLVYVMGELKTTKENLLEKIVVYNYSYGQNLQTIGLGYFKNNQYNISPQSSYSGLTYFKIGSGTTEVTKNDYNLEQLIEENVFIEFQGMHTIKELTFSLTVTNNNAEEISISELGLFKTFSDQYSSGGEEVLLGRCVLASPVIIPAQETRIFQVTIEI